MSKLLRMFKSVRFGLEIEGRGLLYFWVGFGGYTISLSGEAEIQNTLCLSLCHSLNDHYL